MRFDRFITLNLVQPLRRLLGPLRGRRPRQSSECGLIPVLMYHGISDDSEVGIGPYYRTNTSPAVFRRQMEFLHAEGYQTLTLAEAIESHRKHPLNSLDAGNSDAIPGVGESSAPRIAHHKSIVITFDDGYRDFYIEAFPILRRYGFNATMFLPSSYIQKPRRSFKGKECLTWDEVRELRSNGMHFGSHTVSHPRLVELDWPEIKVELSASKSQIEQELGELSTTFAYPFAFPQMDREFVGRFICELREAGYDCCATTEVGRLRDGDDPYRLKRLPVNSLDDPLLFRAKIEGGYDWLAGPQAVVKQLKWRAGLLRESGGMGLAATGATSN